jgi:hypothetical protein
VAIVVPGVAVNYPNALLAVGLKNSCVPGGQQPQNGAQCIPVEVDWGSMGGTSKIVGFNVGASGGTRKFEDICAIHVDNSGCGSDIQFIFTDTQETYTVAAYDPYALFPVFTKSNTFYVIAGINGETVESQDTTRFSIFNFVPPPVVLPLSEEQNQVSVTGIDMGTASTQLVPTGVNGTLEDAWITLGLAASNTGSATWMLEDGSSNVIAQGTVQVSSGSKINLTLLQLNDIRVRFTNGLKMLCTQSANIGGTVTANLYYRTP